MVNLNSKSISLFIYVEMSLHLTTNFTYLQANNQTYKHMYAIN